jgi:predicted nucleotidyltransferase
LIENNKTAVARGACGAGLRRGRAQGTHRGDSDWDFAIYYESPFDPSSLRARRWDGEVSEIGGWGGGVMNGGAWLTIDDRRVDVHYRDLEEVAFWCEEAEAGRFRKELLLFYVAGIPTYTVMGELALNAVLTGDLSPVEYPDALSESARRRWLDDARASLGYATAALASRGDTCLALANASRAIVEASHARHAARKTWVLNEKGIAAAAGLREAAELLLAASTSEELGVALERVAELI